MAKYTDEQIKKAYICCFDDEGCKNCPLKNDRTTCDNLNEHILDLINRQEAEIKILEADYVKLHANDLLTIAERNAFRKSFYEMVKQSKIIKSEAIIDFTEKLKKRLYDDPIIYTQQRYIVEHDIDNLVKEMVGESK